MVVHVFEADHKPKFCKELLREVLGQGTSRLLASCPCSADVLVG